MPLECLFNSIQGHILCFVSSHSLYYEISDISITLSEKTKDISFHALHSATTYSMLNNLK